MKPRNKLAEHRTESGGIIALYEHDSAFVINFNGQELMHSKASASEALMGTLGVEKLAEMDNARVLIGGLGLGFTLERALRDLPASARVDVVELLPAVVDWNRVYLRLLNGDCLDDPRAEVRIENVVATLRAAQPGSYHSILLDVDNGPIGMVAQTNDNLYSKSGLRLIRTALAPGGRAIFWSAGPDLKFEQRLKKAAFSVKAIPARTHPGAKRAAYLLYVADKPA